jgi:hypothetical protein
MGIGGDFLRGKAAGAEAEHSPQTSAEVNNGAATPPLLHIFRARCLIKYSYNFTLISPL